MIAIVKTQAIQKLILRKRMPLTKVATSFLWVAAMLMALGACSKDSQPNGGQNAGQAGSKNGSPTQQMPAMPVSVVQVKATSAPISTEVVAQTEGAKEVEVRPRVGGILLKKLFTEGASVKAGQALFSIDPEPFKIALANAQAQLAQQQVKVEQTQREGGRLKDLLASQSISQREYDNAMSDNALAKAGILQMQAGVREAQLNLSYTTVTAPSSGVAGRFLFSEGALVSANTSLLTTIVQLSPIWVKFSLSDNELATLGGKVNQNTVKKIELILPNGTIYKYQGKLNFAASVIDPALGTQQLRATFDNPDESLLPGQFVRVRITTGSREGVFMIPQVAVMTNDQGRYVYIVNEKNEVAIRPIVAGDWIGKNWVVLEGLKAGEKVVIDNLLKLHPNAAVVPHLAGDATNPNADSKNDKVTVQ